jgi:uncharacterized membrane protein YidH (DUF202 family)
VAAIDFHALFTVLWSSLLAGVGVTVLFSFVILGWSRASEASREGQKSQATAFMAMAVVALLVFVVAVAFGVTIMLQK